MSPRIGLICFAFGVAQVSPGEFLVGPVLMRLLGDLGLSSSAARSLLLRMRRDGWLRSERVGRQAQYRLAPVLDAAQARLERQLRGNRPLWSGSFNGILYSIPEDHRAFRDRLRRSAHLLGYVTLRPGLLVATTDRFEELIPLVPPQPEGSQVLRMSVTLSAEDSRRIAVELWDLDDLAVRYRAVLADAQARITRAEIRPPPPRRALQDFAAAAFPVYEVGADDPDLPAELLPAGWPGQQTGPTLGRALQVFGPSLRDYLATILGT
ncbi:MAG: hypothetical protein DLM54_06375 [Acidimicrobiales bacterium]|nr:MAG: hypothetical protein DLM54_06375 [Acidimicrobiales bacterium]